MEYGSSERQEVWIIVKAGERERGDGYVSMSILVVVMAIREIMTTSASERDLRRDDDIAYLHVRGRTGLVHIIHDLSSPDSQFTPCIVSCQGKKA